MITYKVPHNSAVQLYDYKSNKQRVVFGPDLVMLEPYESFSICYFIVNVKASHCWYYQEGNPKKKEW